MAAIPSSATIKKPSAPRLASIDIFRGLTIAVMIFVNDLASVHGLPWWTYHAKASQDAMTYVDMVYPFFLFIIGLSMPLAFRQRLKKGTVRGLWWHVIVRSASLIVLGLILANAEKADPARMGISGSVWALIALSGAVLYLSVYTGPEPRAVAHRLLRVIGLAIVIFMYAIFRRTTPTGDPGWIDGSYPEILGLIGYTYFAVSVLYISTRRWLWSPLIWLIALVTFNALCVDKWIVLPKHLPLYIWPLDSGAMASITMAGIVTSVIFLGEYRWQNLPRRVFLALGFAAISLIAGKLLTPLGISKIRATPTWSLYSIAAAVASFTLLYWICDVKKHIRWAFFVYPAGANTLLTYLLPDFYYFAVSAIGLTYFEQHWTMGWHGVIRSVVFTIAMLGIAAALTRCKVRLQL